MFSAFTLTLGINGKGQSGLTPAHGLWGGTGLVRGGPTPMPKKSYAVHTPTPASLPTLGGRRLGDGPAMDLDTR
jgi:hypothetical protein